MDSGMYYGIQQGAIAALNLADDWHESNNKIYRERRKIIWEICDKLNYTYDVKSTGLFVWARIPDGLTANKVTDELLYEYDVFVTPGTIFGNRGEGYIRFSLCIDENKIQEVLTRISKN